MLTDTPMAYVESLEAARRQTDPQWQERTAAMAGDSSVTLVADGGVDGSPFCGLMRVVLKHPQDPKKPLQAMLISVYVAPEHRGLGLADELLHQACEAARIDLGAELFSGTVRDNLMLGAARADDQQLIDAVVRSGADIFLSRDAAGFDLQVGERGSRLSGGQRSLLVLARALVTPSKMLFLDEPTGAMDTQTEFYFIDHLKTALAPDQTLVVSTHRHNMLSICDRLIVIDAGRILADGPRDEVLGRLSAAVKQDGEQ